MKITANIAGRGLVQIEVKHGQLSSVDRVGPIDEEKPFACPGFVDIQINGFAGIDFSDSELTAESAVSVLQPIWKTGVTTICATLITNTTERLERNFKALEEARRLDPQFAATVPCYHLEGPYLSPGESRGAHNPLLMRPPDWEHFSRLQRAAGGNIAMVTLAPELPGACDFIRRARAAGVVVAIGHSDGTAEDIHRAIKAGAQLSTHLGNGCPEWIHRHQNPIWAQIASDQLHASLICDGFHLPPDLVQTVYKAKGIGYCILVTDAVHVATLPPGHYSLVDLGIELLPNGQVVTADRGSMAGSALSMNRAIKVFQDFAGVSLDEALRAATANPGRLIRRCEACTEIAPGQPANVTLFRPERDELRIEMVLFRGERVYSRAGG